MGGRSWEGGDGRDRSWERGGGVGRGGLVLEVDEGDEFALAGLDYDEEDDGEDDGLDDDGEGDVA